MNRDVEFEAYLNLLSRFLRLSARQRDEIRRELQSHLADAVADAMDRGLSRDAAIQQTLEEFGDAAELAARFRDIGRTRRWIMRSTAVAACAMLSYIGFNLFAPDRQMTPLSAGDAGAHRPARETPLPMDEMSFAAGDEYAAENARIEAALRTTVDTITFSETPFESFVTWLQTTTNANIVVRWRALDNIGVVRDTPVDLSLKNVRLERVIEEVFASLPDVALGYSIENGILVIGPRDSLNRRLTLVVYDVQDLLRAIGTSSLPAAASTLSGAASEDPTSGMRNHPTPGSPPPARASSPISQGACAESQMEALITNTVEPDAWASNGGASMLRFINETLVVRAPASVHRELAQLLSGLRDVVDKRAARGAATSGR